jgi:Na+-translocating ferredoxin:NAD+ oxidoreductase subunit E
MNNYRQIISEGFWGNNVILAQNIALCPLLAVTSTATNGLGMGIATTAVLIASNALISLIRSFIPSEVRIPAFIVIIATTVTLVDMTMNAYLHELYKVLGLFIPLIVVNCAVLARAESFASKNPFLPSVVDGLFMGIGFTVALIALGSMREIIGSGTLFSGASLLLGQHFAFLEMTLIPNYKGMLLMILPTGGFIAMGFLIAGKRLLDNRSKQKAVASSSEPVAA